MPDTDATHHAIKRPSLSNGIAAAAMHTPSTITLTRQGARGTRRPAVAIATKAPNNSKKAFVSGPKWTWGRAVQSPGDNRPRREGTGKQQHDDQDGPPVRDVPGDEQQERPARGFSVRVR